MKSSAYYIHMKTKYWQVFKSALVYLEKGWGPNWFLQIVFSREGLKPCFFVALMSS